MSLPEGIDPFRAWSFRAIVSLLDLASRAAGGMEELLESQPFLAAYLGEIASFGFDGTTLAEALEKVDRQNMTRSGTQDHPLEIARSSSGWSPDVLTGWLWCGLVREDPRFGRVLDGLLGRDGLPTRATLAPWFDDRPSVGEMVASGWLEEIDSGHDKVYRVPEPLWEVARGRRAVVPGIRHVPRESLPETEPILPPETAAAVRDRIDDGSRLWILQGGISSGRTTVAGWIASRSGSGLLEVGTEHASAPWVGPLSRMLRAVPVHSLETPPGTRTSWSLPSGHPERVVVRPCGTGSVDCGLGAVRIDLSLPDREERGRHWEAALGHPPSEDLLGLRLSRGAIHSLAAQGSDTQDGIRRIRLEIAERGRHLLEGSAQAMPTPSPAQRLELGPSATADFAALVSRCRHRERLSETLPAAFGHGGTGVRALFKGPSGTGKTLAARHLAARLGRPLWRVDLSAVVSKWIGETEKNLERAFQAAESLDIVLLLDEGDALLAGRTSVSNSTDRYANLETNFLLQRLEAFEGILVATTNAADRIDPAFLRRFDVVMDFPMPDPPERLRLWRMHLPRGHAVRDERLEEIARRCELPGGMIRNAALHATLLSLEAAGPLTDRQILDAVRREYRRAGLSCPSLAERA